MRCFRASLSGAVVEYCCVAQLLFVLFGASLSPYVQLWQQAKWFGFSVVCGLTFRNCQQHE